ncbi:MAG TPA: O-acetylhomoserine aminocarboxypropyltransferase/cysteine synthase family protein [Candidatus Methanomethylophilaceae archaeon]|nr:O-acetylhomoserine aminocarboxypropyltransferase/cysteine synthase family protein [Candidatus Methanomethylophilaceae archaeon]
MTSKDDNNIPGGPGNKKGMRFETLQLHAGQEQPDPTTKARAVPIYLTTSYVFDNCDDAAETFMLRKPGNIYGRLTNDTQAAFEKRMATMEGGSAALAVSSGAAAIMYTIQNLASTGDNIVSATTLYGGTYNYFANTMPRTGITAKFVDPTTEGHLKRFDDAIDDRTKCIFVETIGNPNANLIDIEALGKVAHKHGIPLVVDNTFATPYLFRPLEHGADIVVESATKFIGGHGTVLGGVVIESGKFDYTSGKFPTLSEPDPGYHGMRFAYDAPEAPFCTRMRAILLRDTGACISPVNAFMLLQGTETLSLRVERQVENTKKVVEFLNNHPKVDKVNHPMLSDNKDNELYNRYFPNGAGSIFTFDVKGGKEDAKRFADSLELFSLLANVADVKSLVIHPAGTTHSQLSENGLLEQGIKGTTIRLSIGCEHIEDIFADLKQALDKV